MTPNNEDSTMLRWMALACGVAAAALVSGLLPARAKGGGEAALAARYVLAVADARESPEAAPVVRAGASVWRAADAAHSRPALRGAAEEPTAAVWRPAASACPPGSARTRTVSVDDGRSTRRVEWADASCEVEVVVEGEVTFNGDFTEFASISRGGRIRITERGDGVDRYLEIEPVAGGELTYTLRDSGREAPFDGEARAWLRGLVPELLRISGIAAEERAAWLVRTQGAEGLFREVERMHGDRAQRLYLEAWLNAGAHDPAETARALDVAGSQLKSDRELSMVLLRVIEVARVEGVVREPFMRALGTIESDREYGRVASALLGGTGGPR